MQSVHFKLKKSVDNHIESDYSNGPKPFHDNLDYTELFYCMNLELRINTPKKDRDSSNTGRVLFSSYSLCRCD